MSDKTLVFVEILLGRLIDALVYLEQTDIAIRIANDEASSVHAPLETVAWTDHFVLSLHRVANYRRFFALINIPDVERASVVD